MSGAEVLDVGRDAIWLTIQMCAPVLIVGLIVGVGIGLLQALTQIQEMTLTFVPKLLAVGATVLLLGHWMLTTLANYATALISNIPSYF